MERSEARAIGRRISSLLESSGMSQKELAEHIGATPAAVCRYVSGKRVPRAETLAKTAAALGVSSESLLGYDKGKVARAVETVIGAAADMDDEERLALIAAIASAGRRSRP